MRNFFIKTLLGVYGVALLFLTVDLVQSEVPDQIYVREGESTKLNLCFPFSIADEDVPAADGESRQCHIFGVIPLKSVTVSVTKGKQAYLGGEIVGIYTEAEGIFVISTCEFETADGKLVQPAKEVVRTGDYILSIDQQPLSSKEEMLQIIGASEGKELTLRIRRDGKEKEVKLQPKRAKNGDYLAGIWVKDDQAGVGTLTYVLPTGEFGTLGHGMSNGENNEIFEASDGELYVSSVIGIEKGKVGKAGQLKGVIQYGSLNHLGEVEKNTECGVFGKADAEDLAKYKEEDLYEIAFKQEIHTGEAQIVSEISGKKEFYDIRITYVDYLSFNHKGLHIEVTDPRLLELTGGIVQGMSGSPIIQDGKIIGAVTHVLVNDPTRGYGIFIENMLEH